MDGFLENNPSFPDPVMECVPLSPAELRLLSRPSEETERLRPSFDFLQLLGGLLHLRHLVWARSFRLHGADLPQRVSVGSWPCSVGLLPAGGSAGGIFSFGVGFGASLVFLEAVRFLALELTGAQERHRAEALAPCSGGFQLVACAWRGPLGSPGPQPQWDCPGLG